MAGKVNPKSRHTRNTENTDALNAAYVEAADDAATRAAADAEAASVEAAERRVDFENNKVAAIKEAEAADYGRESTKLPVVEDEEDFDPTGRLAEKAAASQTRKANIRRKADDRAKGGTREESVDARSKHLTSRSAQITAAVGAVEENTGMAASVAHRMLGSRVRLQKRGGPGER